MKYTEKVYEAGQKLGNCYFVRLPEVQTKVNREAYFLCGFCGTEFLWSITRVKNFHRFSCGCTSQSYEMTEVSPNATKHGLMYHPLSGYKSWCSIKDRCYNKNDRGYSRYGSRGIKVCDRWLGEDGFKNFHEDMGFKPSKEHSLDRWPDRNGNYEPGNCRWATYREQANNKNTNHFVTLYGETKTIAEWSIITKLEATLICNRLKKGWSPLMALNTRPSEITNNQYTKNKGNKLINHTFGHI